MSVEVQKTSDIEVTRRPPPRTVRAMRVRARRVLARRRAPAVLVADAAHRRPQPRRPCRAARRLPLSQPVSRRTDRCARAKPRDPGRDHRRGDRRLGDGRYRCDHDRSRKAAAACAWPELRPWPRKRGPAFEFSINPERVGPLLRRLVSPTRTRARIYDRDGVPLDRLALADQPLDDPALGSAPRRTRRNRSPGSSAFGPVVEGLSRSPRAADLRGLGAANGKAYPEVAPRSPAGRNPSCASTRRAKRSSRSQCRSSASAPCGARCCCRRKAATSTRSSPPSGWAILAHLRRRGGRHVAALAASRRHHRRAGAPARRGRRSRAPRHQVAPARFPISPIARTRSAISPAALRDMTKALYTRIEAIESFAADVAHELKNPLTSLRSAVETLPIAKTRGVARPAARRHPARRAPARPADQRHLRRLSPRRGTRAWRDGAGRSFGAARGRRLDGQSGNEWPQRDGHIEGRRTAGRISRAPFVIQATIRGSARSSPI